MHYAFSFSLTLIYFEVPLFINFSNRFIFSVNAPFTREKSVFGSSFFFKNEDFCTLLQPSLLPFSKDTTFYLYYIVNVDSMYTYHFLFNSSSNSSTCCNVSPFINEKSDVPLPLTPTRNSLFFIFINYHKIKNINLLFNNNI